MKNLTVAVLGTGSMGGAIVEGLLASGVPASNITVTTRTEVSASTWRSHEVTALSLDSTPAANLTAVAGADLILLAVKPAYVVEVLTEAASSLKPGSLVVSVAAGITTATMEAQVPDSVAVVRAMPNTPSVIKLGMTGIAVGSRVSQQQLELVQQLFGAIGKTLTVPESQIDALSTVSGSGPAYVFFFIEQLTLAAENLGFTADEATFLVNETFRGAADYLIASGKSAAELRAQVTSPNGTTMRAIAELEKLNLAAGFESALLAALARAQELSAGK